MIPRERSAGPESGPKVELREITRENWLECCRPKVRDDQDRLMIDKDHQGRGHGRAALLEVVRRMGEKYAFPGGRAT